jgi:hypothetical protein
MLEMRFVSRAKFLDVSILLYPRWILNTALREPKSAYSLSISKMHLLTQIVRSFQPILPAAIGVGRGKLYSHWILIYKLKGATHGLQRHLHV